MRRLLAAFLVAQSCAAVACTPFVETRAGSASFRPHATAFERCVVSEAAYRQVLVDWLRSPEASGAGHDIASLALGRAVAFPWLSRHLADAALRRPGWAARSARATQADRDGMAAAVLRDPALLARLAAPFDGTPVVVAGLAFEKILFGPADRHASDTAAGTVPVPFDAQITLRLVRRASPSPSWAQPSAGYPEGAGP